MHTMDNPREIDLTIPMEPDMEMAAIQTAEAVLRFFAFGEEQIDEVKHAMIEGCINAFEHSASPERRVYIKFMIHQGELLVRIRDFGSGFDPQSVPRPVLADKVKPGGHKRGWGLLLMESLMDSVEIESSPAGTTITMTKKRA